MNESLLIGVNSGLLLVNSKGIKQISIGYAAMVYGITYISDALFVFLRGIKVPEMLVFNNNLDIVQRYKYKNFSDLHQAQVFNNHIWVAISGKNCYALIDLRTRRIKQFFYPIPDAKGSDINHFNSIFFDGNYRYCVAHNKASKLKIKSELFVFQKDTKLFSVDCGVDSHNIMPYKNSILILDSKGHTIQKIENRKSSVFYTFARKDLFYRGWLLMAPICILEVVARLHQRQIENTPLLCY